MYSGEECDKQTTFFTNFRMGIVQSVCFKGCSVCQCLCKVLLHTIYYVNIAGACYLPRAGPQDKVGGTRRKKKSVFCTICVPVFTCICAAALFKPNMLLPLDSRKKEENAEMGHTSQLMALI